MQDLVAGHALLALGDEAIPGFDRLPRLVPLRDEVLEFGIEAFAGELAIRLVLRDVPLHMFLARAAVLLAALVAALVVDVQVALHLVIPLEVEAMVAVAETVGGGVSQGRDRLL